jgi:cysteine synthase B
MSSGAALWAARVLAAEVDAATIVTILPDRGDKYLSTGLFRV